MTEREDWEKCVNNGPRDRPVALCDGRSIHGQFHLLDRDHAFGCVESQCYVQPCPACWKIIEQEKSVAQNR